MSEDLWFIKMEKMNIELRLERPSDYRETENITREAFWNYHAPRCDEHYLLHIMRDCPMFVPELDVVAVYDGKIIGNVVYCKSAIKTDDGNEYEVLGLGPISVLPEYQSKGIGKRMIEHTKQLARAMGFCAILLYGDPNYYSRHGFISAETLGIRTSDDMYAAALQVCELYEDALSKVKGRYFEDGIYNVDATAAEEFDKNFPVKEAVTGTPSQKRFLEVVAMRRKAK
jgi:predicted N-acetyltransferase YhbS